MILNNLNEGMKKQKIKLLIYKMKMKLLKLMKNENKINKKSYNIARIKQIKKKNLKMFNFNYPKINEI